MDKIISSELYKTVMYLLFILGVFFTVGVKLSHGGIFGELVVPSLMRCGEILILLACCQWGALRLFEKASHHGQ